MPSVIRSEVLVMLWEISLLSMSFITLTGRLFSPKPNPEHVISLSGADSGPAGSGRTGAADAFPLPAAFAGCYHSNTVHPA